MKITNKEEFFQKMLKTFCIGCEEFKKQDDIETCSLDECDLASEGQCLVYDTICEVWGWEWEGS